MFIWTPSLYWNLHIIYDFKISSSQISISISVFIRLGPSLDTSRFTIDQLFRNFINYECRRKSKYNK
jgi:hypothetical protein